MTAAERAEHRLLRTALLAHGFHPGEGHRADGRPLGWILDARESVLRGSVLEAAGRLLWALARKDEPDAVGGVGVSGAPLVGAVLLAARAEGRDLDGFLQRPAAKPYGLRRATEGRPPGPGRVTVLVDDLVQSGSTVDALARAVTATGGRVAAAVVLVDLHPAVRRGLGTSGVLVRSVFSAAELGIRGEPHRTSNAQPAGGAGYRWTNLDGAGTAVRLGDRVFVTISADGGQLICRIGEEARWCRIVGTEVTAPAVGNCGETVAVGNGHGSVIALDPASGTRGWRVDVGSAVAGVVCDPDREVVYAARCDGVVVAVGEGRCRWQRRIGRWTATAPVVVADVVVALGPSHLVGVSREEGQLRWVVPRPPGPASTLLMAAGGSVVVTNAAGEIALVVDAVTGRPAYPG